MENLNDYDRGFIDGHSEGYDEALIDSGSRTPLGLFLLVVVACLAIGFCFGIAW